jgi:hypothetical protein
MILSLVVATMFWMQGGTLVEQLHDIFGRLGGATAEKMLDAGAGTVRSVAYCMIENARSAGTKTSWRRSAAKNELLRSPQPAPIVEVR